jgi:hypothetical protein
VGARVKKFGLFTQTSAAVDPVGAFINNLRIEKGDLEKHAEQSRYGSIALQNGKATVGCPCSLSS